MSNFIFSGSLDEAKQAGFIIIDIRRPNEWAERKLPQADKEIEMTELLLDPHKFLDPKQDTLLVCKAGIRAINTTESLRQMGFQQVFAFPSAW